MKRKIKKALPPSYTEPPSVGVCQDCEFVFRKREYEEADEFFCCQDGSERPMCGSVCMGEAHGGTMAEFSKWVRSWDRWAARHEVFSRGTCARWKAQEVKP